MFDFSKNVFNNSKQVCIIFPALFLAIKKNIYIIDFFEKDLGKIIMDATPLFFYSHCVFIP